MPSFSLTNMAKADLKGIALYTKSSGAVTSATSRLFLVNFFHSELSVPKYLFFFLLSDGARRTGGA